MNIQRLKESGVNYEDGLDRFSGNQALYEKYLYKLLDLTLYDDMKQALARDNIQEAFSCIHKLKAFIGNLSIDCLYEDVQALTEKLRGGIPQDVSADIEKIDREYDAVLLAIRGE